MKYFKEGDYYVNLVHPSLRSIIDDEDFTDMVSDFSKFSYLGVDVMGDTIRLINTPDKGFIFVRYPSADGKFIRANEILKIRRKKKMNEAGMNRELTPEEKIEQLEKEKAALELQIKNQEKYDEIRKIGDELALYMKALQDSGFSRDEAMQIFMITSMNAVIPPCVPFVLSVIAMITNVSAYPPFVMNTFEPLST